MKRKGAHLGQHFLTSKAAVVRMMDAAGAVEGTVVLEIGSGKGVLTKELLARGATVIAIEKDSGLAALLRETFAQEIAEGRLVLIEDDIRDVDIPSIVSRHPSTERAPAADAVRERNESQASRTNMYGERGGDVSDKEMRGRRGSYVVCANIPYYITGEIIRTLLTAAHQPTSIALLIQKEVAERIVARDKKESILSLSVKAYGEPRIVAKVPRGAFAPPPSVDSAILSIENISRGAFAGIREEDFFKVVKAGFANKRKMLAGNLRALAPTETVTHALAECGIEASARAEDVPLLQWIELSKRLLA